VSAVSIARKHPPSIRSERRSRALDVCFYSGLRRTQRNIRCLVVLDSARRDDSRLGYERRTDPELHPKTGLSASGATLRPWAAVFGVPSGRKKGVRKPIL